jgi:hypothetical protein
MTDQQMQALFARARRLEPTEAEVASALTATPRRRGPRERWVLVLAAAGALLAAAVAAAATGLLPVGSVFRDEGFTHGPRSVRETVVATGRVPVSGRWRITIFKTKAGTHCIKLALLDGGRPRASGYCAGDITRFDAFNHGGRRDAARRGQVILFGPAPERSREIELTAAGGVRIAAPTKPGPANVSRRFWLIAASPRLKDARISWLDRRGHRSPPLDVSGRFSGPATPTVVATGTAPVAGPWRMLVSESRRGMAQGGDIYEAEGLPCIDIRLLHAPRGGSLGGGACGEIRETPGFFRAQHSVPSKPGGPVKEILLYGRAPERADTVEVSVRDSVKVAVKTRRGASGVPGRYWLIAAPARLIEGGRVYWVDRDTGKRGLGLEVLPP